MPLHKILNIGDRIPDFELQDQHGQCVKRIDFEGKPLVIFFYPKDHTPGCTAEACSFRDYESEFQAAGAQVIGINDAEVSMHKSFADKYGLSYPVLSDPGHLVRKSFGAPDCFLILLQIELPMSRMVLIKWRIFSKVYFGRMIMYQKA